ncbi:hypothetical protein ACFXAW_07245 [Streptomyces sp. NPDC059445]|uniref:hypothetical protein n=1 Tax=Streptomyces sp. NPDC059445 TaxID=3346832 RepID=UPI0036B3143D
MTAVNRRLADAIAAKAVPPSADLLPGTGACKACGDLPAAWCPDCAACETGCFGGHDDNPCNHENANWGTPR